ncbi:MAG: arsenate reductase (azurin) small subunit [Acidimicrobiia bacterium]|jgi:arsenite oxidase small subunit
MTELTRREFLLIGVAGGAVAAVGVIVPLSQTQNGEQVAVGDGSTSTTTTLPPPPSAVIGFFPKVRVASVGEVSTTDPVKFDYPLQGQRNVLVKLNNPVSYGVGPDQDIVSFSSICTHMGCLLEEYKPEYNALGPCPCHFSTFDLANNGMVTLGQATQNLPQVLLSIEGDDIYATGVVRLVYGYADTLQGAPMVEVS